MLPPCASSDFVRSNDFPLRIDVAGVVYAPAMLASFDDVTQVWVAVNGVPTLVASGRSLSTKDPSVRGQRLSDGAKARWAAVLDDGTVWLVGHHAHCCSCHRNPLCGFVPPEPAVTVPAEATA